MNEIDGALGLWIGNSSDARNTKLLREQGFTAVLNVATDLHSPFEVMPMRFKVGLTDGPSNDLRLYESAAQILKILLDTNNKVLLHCHEGRSRSSAVATLFLSEYRSCSLKEAWQYVYERRPVCAKMEMSHWANLEKIAEERDL